MPAQPETQHAQPLHATRLPLGTIAGAALAPGVGTAVAMWVVWWLLHMPGIQPATTAIVVALVLTKGISLTLWARWTGARAAIPSTVLAALAAAVLNLLLLGAKIVEQPQTTTELIETGTRL